jgi:hypothetical protein
MDMDAGNVFYRRGDCLQVAEMASNINDILFCVDQFGCVYNATGSFAGTILFNCFLDMGTGVNSDADWAEVECVSTSAVVRGQTQFIRWQKQVASG